MFSKHLGFRYGSNQLTKHSNGSEQETVEVYDYEHNQYFKRAYSRKYTNKQTGTDLAIGFGYFPEPKPALMEGNKCTEVAVRDERYQALAIGHCSKNLTPKEGDKDSESDEERGTCPPDPQRPGLRYKRTRRSKSSYKEGDSVNQRSVGIGFSW